MNRKDKTACILKLRQLANYHTVEAEGKAVSRTKAYHSASAGLLITLANKLEAME